MYNIHIDHPVLKATYTILYRLKSLKKIKIYIYRTNA
jgi:hypothetical protein